MKHSLQPAKGMTNWGNASETVRVGDLIFVSGQLPLGGDGQIAGSDVATQARAAFENLRYALADSGASMTDVIKHNVYFVCPPEQASITRFLTELDAVSDEYFTRPGPARTEVRVGLDQPGALLMLDAIAAVGGDRKPIAPAEHRGRDRDLPFAHAWRVGDLVFIGAQRSVDRDGKLFGTSDIEAQTETAFGHLEAILTAAGGDRNDLVRHNTYYHVPGTVEAATAYWQRMTKVRLRYLSTPTPSGVGLEVPGFRDVGELIEVEGIAYLGRDRKRLQPPDHWDVPTFPNAMFSQGWRAGSLVLVGGQVSVDAQAKAVGDDLDTQTRNVFRFVGNVLREAGLDERDVARLAIYYLDNGDPKRVAEIRTTIARIQREYYPQPGPAVVAYGVTGYSFADLFIEMEAIAAVRGRPSRS